MWAEITESDLDLYITFDNEKVGETQAQYLVDSLPKGKKSKIVRIYGAPTDNNAKLFLNFINLFSSLVALL